MTDFDGLLIGSLFAFITALFVEWNDNKKRNRAIIISSICMVSLIALAYALDWESSILPKNFTTGDSNSSQLEITDMNTDSDTEDVPPVLPSATHMPTPEATSAPTATPTQKPTPTLTVAVSASNKPKNPMNTSENEIAVDSSRAIRVIICAVIAIVFTFFAILSSIRESEIAFDAGQFFAIMLMGIGSILMAYPIIDFIVCQFPMKLWIYILFFILVIVISIVITATILAFVSEPFLSIENFMVIATIWVLPLLLILLLEYNIFFHFSWRPYPLLRAISEVFHITL